MEIKVKTFIQPLNTEADAEQFLRAKNHSAWRPSTSRFIYDSKTKTFYDCKIILSYRCVEHSLCFDKHDFVFEGGIEPNYIIRFSFHTNGFISENGVTGGEYEFCDLGIPGIELSVLYKKWLDSSGIDKLKSYDLDLIESYVKSIQNEHEQIRQTEEYIHYEYKNKKRNILADREKLRNNLYFKKGM